jgi:CHAD domain-containing protein
MLATMETRRFASKQTARLLQDLALQIDRTTKSCNADVVHDVRVSIRRFTQAIAVCKPCLPGKDMRKIRRRLTKIMVAAGEVRNCDVALKFMTKSRLPDAVQLQSKVQGHRKPSARILLSELKRWTAGHTFVRWRAVLEAALAGNGDAFGETAIEEVARQTLRRMAKDFLERGNEAASSKASPEDLHRFRIVAKKFRYTLELFGPLYGSSLNGGMARIRRAQTLLGDVNDCVTVCAYRKFHILPSGSCCRRHNRQSCAHSSIQSRAGDKVQISARVQRFDEELYRPGSDQAARRS